MLELGGLVAKKLRYDLPPREMKMRSFLRRSAISLSAVAALLPGCNGLQPPIGAAGAMAQSRPAPSRADYPMADPTVLDFHSRRPLWFTVRQTGYHGWFYMSDPDCVPFNIAHVSPKSAKAPKAIFKVTPIETASGGTCLVTVADAQKRTATVTVNNPGY
jgi:hypothetical protein